MPRMHIYAATKGALNALTITLARDLGPFGVRVNCINPSPMRQQERGIRRITLRR
jgi:NAD(P)-dependent dehydrogenase (short-subunit alcohol dehydrogenase family)